MQGGVRGFKQTPLAPGFFVFCLLACQRGNVWGYPTPGLENLLNFFLPPPPTTFSGLTCHHGLHPIVKHLPWKSCICHCVKLYTFYFYSGRLFPLHIVRDIKKWTYLIDLGVVHTLYPLPLPPPPPQAMGLQSKIYVCTYLYKYEEPLLPLLPHCLP